MPALGRSVSVRARYGNLAREVERIATAAGLGYGADRNADGAVIFSVRTTRDRSATSTKPVIFSLALGSAQVVTLTEDGVRSPNVIYTLGSGSGNGRLQEVVEDSADVDIHFRRELSLDARDATSADAAQDAARAELARHAAERLRILVQPPALGPYRYRDDWDVGDVVTIDLPDLGLRVDQRVDSVRCRADPGEPLEISCAFGAASRDAATALRRLDERTAPGRFV